ncbi:hypothetical protein BKG85_11565 [Mycobacteroides chelonae]|nr:hypothetical protein BKG85_11565 [Mycobacteroides chelonae]
MYNRLTLPLEAGAITLVAANRGIEWLAIAPATVMGHTHVADDRFAATVLVGPVNTGHSELLI